MLKIQEFIECFNTMEEAALYLRRSLNIESYQIFMEEGYSIWHFKPTQKADLDNPLVREAHCLILYNDGELLARAWPRPYTVTDVSHTPGHFLWSRAICEEEPDGDIVVVYNVEGEWCIGTLDSIDGNEYLPGMRLPTMTYEHEIKAMLSRRYQGRWSAAFANTNPFMCFIFSYVSPYLGKVMPILAPDLILRAVVNTEADEEITHGMVQNLAMRMDLAPNSWTEINGTNSLSTRLWNMRALAPGLTLRDTKNHRIFIPNPIHKAVQSARDAGERVRPTHIAKILQATRDRADVTAVGAAYESFAPMLELLYHVREDVYQELKILWQSSRKYGKNDPAEFAKMVQHHPLNYLLFMLRDEAIDSLRIAMDNLKPIKLTRLAINKWEREFTAAERLLKYSGGTSNGNVEKEEDFEEAYQKGSGSEEGCIPFSHDGD